MEFDEKDKIIWRKIKNNGHFKSKKRNMIKNLRKNKANPIAQRHITALMGCLGLVNAYLMRQCLSPTITQLVLPRNYSKEDIEKKAVCMPDDDFFIVANKGTLDWDQKLQSLCLSSFYIGYLITHLPGGYLADKYGSKWILMLGILSTAIFTLLTPLAIDYGGAYGLITLRIMMGLGEGTTFPALSVLMADWIPLRERGFLGSLVMGGGQIGSILSNSITGWILQKYHWHTVFYVWAIVGLLWCFFFTIMCYSSPMEHPCITDKEKEYIQQEIGDMSARRRELPFPPLKSIFTSCPIWSLIAAQIGHDWAFYIIATYLPKYMNDVLQMQIKRNGIMSSLPSLCMWIFSILSGIFADILINSGAMKTTPVRKLMTGIASFGPAIFLITASYSGCHYVIVIVNFCIGMAFMGSYYGGMKLTPIDMSPNYAGIVMAINNGIGSATGFIAPTSVGWMTPNTTLQEWRLVFWVAFGVLTVTGIIYCIWAKSEVQPWNEPKRNKNRQSLP